VGWGGVGWGGVGWGGGGAGRGGGGGVGWGGHVCPFFPQHILLCVVMGAPCTHTTAPLLPDTPPPPSHRTAPPPPHTPVVRVFHPDRHVPRLLRRLHGQGMEHGGAEESQLRGLFKREVGDGVRAVNYAGVAGEDAVHVFPYLWGGVGLGGGIEDFVEGQRSTGLRLGIGAGIGIVIEHRLLFTHTSKGLMVGQCSMTVGRCSMTVGRCTMRYGRCSMRCGPPSHAPAPLAAPALPPPGCSSGRSRPVPVWSLPRSPPHAPRSQ
jgi:hypothetical protein